jgi:hypothetical protein
VTSPWSIFIFLGGDVEQLHEVIVDEAHDRLVKADLDQEEGRSEQETRERGLREHARAGTSAQGIGRGEQEHSNRKPKHGRRLGKARGPVGRPGRVDEEIGHEDRERDAEGRPEQFERKPRLDGQDVHRRNQGEDTKERRQQPRHRAGGKAKDSDQNGLQAEQRAPAAPPIPCGSERERHVTQAIGPGKI